jgi:hypothetical protein
VPVTACDVTLAERPVAVSVRDTVSWKLSVSVKDNDTVLVFDAVAALENVSVRAVTDADSVWLRETVSVTFPLPLAVRLPALFVGVMVADNDLVTVSGKVIEAVPDAVRP